MADYVCQGPNGNDRRECPKGARAGFEWHKKGDKRPKCADCHKKYMNAQKKLRKNSRDKQKEQDRLAALERRCEVLEKYILRELEKGRNTETPS